MKENISLLISEDKITERIGQIAGELSAGYKALNDSRPVVVVGVLKG